MTHSLLFEASLVSIQPWQKNIERHDTKLQVQYFIIRVLLVKNHGKKCHNILKPFFFFSEIIIFLYRDQKSNVFSGKSILLLLFLISGSHEIHILLILTFIWAEHFLKKADLTQILRIYIFISMKLEKYRTVSLSCIHTYFS